MKPKSIYLGGIVGRFYEPDHVVSLMATLACPEIAMYRPRRQDALLCRARARVAYEFLQTDCEVLLSVDSDIAFRPSQAIQICEQAAACDVVGGQYVSRATGRFCYPTSLVENDTRVVYSEDPTPVPAKFIAGGFIAVHRRVFEKLSTRADCPLLHANVPSMTFRPYYTSLWIQGENELVYLSEDWALCERARQEGFGVYLNPAVRLQHMGPYPYRLEDMLASPLETQPLALTREAGGQYIRESAAPPAVAEPPADGIAQPRVKEPVH